MRYSTEHLKFLKQHWPLCQLADLTEKFNQQFGLDKTDSQIRAALKNHKIHCGRAGGNVSRGNYKAFTQDQAQFIKDEYKRLSLRALTAAFNERFGTDKTEGKIRAFTRNHGVKSGRNGHYEKGAKPWNNGTKGQGLTGPNSGSFKKGAIPGNTKPLGTERIDTKDGYLLRKVAVQNPHTGAKTSYQPVHRLNWEAENGSIPDGYAVIFKDGNRLNPDISNLELMSRQELLQLNRISRQLDCSPEYRDTLIMLARIETKTFQLQRGDL